MMNRRGVILITTSKSTMVRSGSIVGNHLRGLSTTVRRDERFFTKKHEWVEVEGTKGLCRNCYQYLKLISITFRHGGHI